MLLRVELCLLGVALFLALYSADRFCKYVYSKSIMWRQTSEYSQNSLVSFLSAVLMVFLNLGKL